MSRTRSARSPLVIAATLARRAYFAIDYRRELVALRQEGALGECAPVNSAVFTAPEQANRDAQAWGG